MSFKIQVSQFYECLTPYLSLSKNIKIKKKREAENGLFELAKDFEKFKENGIKLIYIYIYIYESKGKDLAFRILEPYYTKR